MRAVLSIGSNLGNRVELLQSVVNNFRAAGELVAASSVYTTAPWGVKDQEDFLNAVLIIDVPSSPMELLRRGQGMESAAQRTRQTRWGPRTLDVDIVTITDETGELVSTDPVLTLPHPNAHNRAFVLVPWLEVEPEAQLGGRAVVDWVAELDRSDLAGVTISGVFD